MAGGLAPTRQNLLAVQRRLSRVARGTALLRRKREALVSELLRLARPAVAARASIDELAERAYPKLLAALAQRGHDGLRALGWPARTFEVELRAGQLWGVPIAELQRHPPVRRTFAARGTPPATAGLAASEAAGAFEDLTELLLDAANREALLARLGAALARTSRQVNTLERRLTPSLAETRTRIRRTLDEREREEHLRLERLVNPRRG
jgi:V/A-type H+-transporting ATPase subunit D